jgi:putative tryptophan/tyrosine transport system substrate-binding protein
MRRRKFITLVSGAAASWPAAARAQQRMPVKRVGWIPNAAAEDDAFAQAVSQALSEALEKLGWKEGGNLLLDRRTNLGGDFGRFRLAAAELVKAAPDVILCQGTPQTAIFKQLTATIPIVFVNVADPVASGFVASFARPGGDITGFVSLEYSLAGKWLSILKDIAPAVNRVMVLFNPVNSNWTGYLPTIEAGAPSLQVEVTPVKVSNAEDVSAAVESFARLPNSGMIVLPATTTIDRHVIVSLAAKHRLPAIYPYDYFAEAGGLVSYGSDTRDLYRRAASYIDRILRGEKPADLPVQASVKFELVINLKAAKALGLDVPYNVLILADRVID